MADEGWIAAKKDFDEGTGMAKKERDEWSKKWKQETKICKHTMLRIKSLEIAGYCNVCEKILSTSELWELRKQEGIHIGKQQYNDLWVNHINEYVNNLHVCEEEGCEFCKLLSLIEQKGFKAGQESWKDKGIMEDVIEVARKQSRLDAFNDVINRLPLCETIDDVIKQVNILRARKPLL